MAQFSTTLSDLVGSIRQVKPNCPPTRCRDIVNQVLRSVLDARPYWSGLLKAGVLSVPTAYTTGTVAFTAGSAIVTGSSTVWPVTDLVNTTLPNAVTEPGSQIVTPASMTGITEDVVLRVDTGTDEELISVLEVNATSFRAVFTKTHDEGVAVVSSSYVGRQIRTAGRYPIYTIKAVRSATELELDLPWAGAALSGQTYSIEKRYYTFAHDAKDILWCFDPVQPRELELHYPHEQLNASDPQRTASGDPRLISDVRPTDSGNMQYELYPLPSSARQLPFMYVRQWPEMRTNSHRLPPFMSPNLILFGSYSMALRTKHEDKDNFYDPAGANFYETKYREELIAAGNADDGKCQQMLTYERGRWGPSMGGDWNQSHDVSVYDGNQWW